MEESVGGYGSSAAQSQTILSLCDAAEYSIPEDGDHRIRRHTTPLPTLVSERRGRHCIHNAHSSHPRRVARAFAALQLVLLLLSQTDSVHAASQQPTGKPTTKPAVNTTVRARVTAPAFITPRTSSPVTPTTTAPVTATTTAPVVPTTPAAPVFVTPRTHHPSVAPVTVPPSAHPTARAATTHRPISKIPSSSPTIRMSMAPSGFPSFLPSHRPSQHPSRNPSQHPSRNPSQHPSRNPSQPPSHFPSEIPSNQPSLTPTVSAKPTTLTMSPTRSAKPSSLPSDGPTRVPSLAPSTTPTLVPSGAPTTAPTTNAPSTFPSNQPSLTPQSAQVKAVMLLSYTAGTLSGQSKLDFESVTGSFLKAQIQMTYFAPPVVLLQSDVTITNQTVQPKTSSTTNNNNSSRTRRRRQNRRFLQQAQADELRVHYDVHFVYQSIKQDYDPSVWVSDAFNTTAKRQLYIAQLQQANPKSFANLQQVQYLPNGSPPTTAIPPVQDGNNAQGTNRNLYIIVGAVAGGCLVVLLLVAIVMLKNRRHDQHQQQNSKVKSGATPYSFRPFSLEGTRDDSNDRLVYAAEIDVDRQDDVSTLGDPVLGGHTMMMTTMLGAGGPGEEVPTGSGETDDYDYNRHFLGARTSSDLESEMGSRRSSSASEQSKKSALAGSGGDRGLGQTVFADDSSFEEQFGFAEQRYTVEVPPGKLGMVIDTPNAGPPIVHAIKPESVLYEKSVKVGDQLVAVDDEDVTQMNAVQISRLICARSNQQRSLVFVRARGRFDSADLIVEDGAC